MKKKMNGEIVIMKNKKLKIMTKKKLIIQRTIIQKKALKM